MKPARTRKKNLIVSYKNLTPELLELLKETYPEGYKDYITRFEKPNGESIFVVPIETEDTCYMIKMDVKVDSALAADAELDKEMYGDDGGEDMEFESLDIVDKDSDNPDHRESHLHHGDYEEALDPKAKLKKNVELSKEIAEAFGDDNTDEYDDDYIDDDDDDDDDIDMDKDPEDDFEPSMEDIMGIEDEMGNLILPEDAELADRHNGSKKSSKKPEPAAEPKKRGRKKKE